MLSLCHIERIYDRHMVRTDAREQTLEAFLPLSGVMQGPAEAEAGEFNRV